METPAPKPLKLTPLHTYVGLTEERLAQLRGALLLCLAGFLCLAGLTAYAVHKALTRDIAYITIGGIQRAGYITPATAEQFVRDFEHWLHTFTWFTIHDRNSYLAPLVCPAIGNEFVKLLTDEAVQVDKNRINQTSQIREITYDAAASKPGEFVFRVVLSRSSSLLANAQTQYDETYQVQVLQAPNVDGTRRLCVLRHTRLTSRLLNS